MKLKQKWACLSFLLRAQLICLEYWYVQFFLSFVQFLIHHPALSELPGLKISFLVNLALAGGGLGGRWMGVYEALTPLGFISPH